MLDGGQFTIFADHKPLTFPQHRCPTLGQHASPGNCHTWQYTLDFRHIAGAANLVADTLSRPPGHAAAEGPPSAATFIKVPSGSQVVALQGGKLNSSTPSLLGVAAGVVDMHPAVGISFPKMAANQANCISTLQATKSSSLTVKTVQVEGASLLSDVARGITRPLVDRPVVFHAVHSMANPGMRVTRRIVSAHFAWKGVDKDVAAMCRDSQQCQRGKIHKQPAAPLHAIPCWHANFPTCTWTWWVLSQPPLTATCTC
jgi:hypothetical protein